MEQSWKHVTYKQVRGARCSLGMSGAELAKRAGVGVSTVRRWERGEGIRPAQATMIIRVLEGFGVQFTRSGARGDRPTLSFDPGDVIKQ